MKCPVCQSAQTNKNGRRGAKQSYRCKDCGRQFVEFYSSRGYSSDAKQICLNLYHNGMGFRAIERATGVSHNTVINWVREKKSMPLDVAEPLDAELLDAEPLDAEPLDAEYRETTQLDAWHELSEEDLFDSQQAENWLTHSRSNVLVIYRLRFLPLVAHTITPLCSVLKRSKSCQQFIANHSLLVSLT